MTTFSYRAASPDNAFDIQAIIELFTAVYGETYPLPNVYDPLFWRQHIGTRFTSTLIYDGRKLVGHLAAQPEGIDGKMIQVLFPLCHPDVSRHLDAVLSLAWNVFEQQAKKQQWHGIYYFAFADVPEMVRFGEQILRVKSVAVCPAYFPAWKSSPRDKNSRVRSDIIIGQRFFKPEHEKQRSIYISSEHSELVSRLYEALKLPREIRTSVRKEKLASYPLPADRTAIETRYFAKSGIMHVYIEPSLVVSESELAAHFINPHSESTFAFVKGYDPRALEVSSWLESHGFEFSGVLPFIHDRESLLFSHTSAENSVSQIDAETVLLAGFSAY